MDSCRQKAIQDLNEFKEQYPDRFKQGTIPSDMPLLLKQFLITAFPLNEIPNQIVYNIEMMEQLIKGLDDRIKTTIDCMIEKIEEGSKK